MRPAVYLAARSEDQAVAHRLMVQLRAEGIGCTARWLSLADLSAITPDQAQLCIDDITAADALVFVQSPIGYRDTSGAHHTEVGIALTLGKPIVLIGQPRNVFHGHQAVTVVARDIVPRDLAFVIRQVTNTQRHSLTCQSRLIWNSDIDPKTGERKKSRPPLPCNCDAGASA